MDKGKRYKISTIGGVFEGEVVDIDKRVVTLKDVKGLENQKYNTVTIFRKHIRGDGNGKLS